MLNAAQAFADDADSQEKVNELRRSMESLDRVKKIYLNHRESRYSAVLAPRVSNFFLTLTFSLLAVFEFLKSSVWAEILPLVRDSV